MGARGFSYLMMIFAGVGVLIGTGVLTTDRSLTSLCQKGCWLNSLLFAMFGETMGKVTLASIWYGLAALALSTGIRIWRRSTKK
jgi:hypothetical protein